MWSKRILPKSYGTVCFSCESVLLSNTIQEFLAGRLAGKNKISLQQIVSINSFDSRWGYGWESNRCSIPVFDYPSQCYEAFGGPSPHFSRHRCFDYGPKFRQCNSEMELRLSAGQSFT